MENNKILIGVQFTDRNTNSEYYHYNIELYVLRDLPLYQLLEGIRYGLDKLASGDSEYQDIYERCRDIYSACVTRTADDGGRQYLTHVTFTSFNNTEAEQLLRGGERVTFYLDLLTKPICDLGFITSSRIIFDATGTFVPKGKLDTSNIIEAFDPKRADKIFFPEYNISSRQLYRFDDSPVEIIDPGEAPQKPDNNLFLMLLPSLVTIGILILVRSVFMSGSPAAGIPMVMLSAALGVTAIITTSINWKKQRQDYEKNLKDWRVHYQNYIDQLLERIGERQEKDTVMLDRLYPDVVSLINQDRRGIYSMNENLYSRSMKDADFLAFRIGRSDQVESMFPVKGNPKEVVFSDSCFDFDTDPDGKKHLHIYLNSELTEEEQEKKENLCHLPSLIADQTHNLKNAPLLYSLNHKGALGIVDYSIDSPYAYSRYFISRMVFELCYYHSPEDLQFVCFFNERHSWLEIEKTMNIYKFMPHFRGLFSDKSQFVFNQESAGMVLSSLLNIMGERKAAASDENAPDPLPHIVVLVFEEYGLKEHAFAEFLPKGPAGIRDGQADLGLTFIFAKKYKEYLPAYCDDIVCFDSGKKTITPHDDVNRRKIFRLPQDAESNIRQHYIEFMKRSARAYRFFSSIYYAHIAQNGRVPSTVSAFEILNPGKSSLEEHIEENWGFGQNRRPEDVTATLKVAIGRTENGTAWLDLHEKADGPHMLVAGTTGSGKTETVITYLIGLCMQFRPDELNLLLVDMKGGGFTKRIGNLPHVVGQVTDVDGDENGTGAEYMLNRFLQAMKSEIKRRKLLFNRMHVDSIDDYIKACRDVEAFLERKKITGPEAERMRKTAVESPLSHLILVVDEFTELKRFSSENSNIDFIGEITTIARVGRSLGFHIILISQNIEGAITDDIRVNSRARLCLKVATRQASKEMLGTELAASPYMPGNGRAYLLVGTGSRFEYFQSGYSGSGTMEDVPVELTLASKTGAYTSFYQSERDNIKLAQKRAAMKREGTMRTQLEAINEAICAVYSVKKDQIAMPHMVFNAPLPSAIAMDREGNVIETARERRAD
ncbi:MAG: FtsK/SpoIIIE domain-containing protein [Eubacterium sp.]|nr:FtsK/SpoIIIE domain-containing protein [Eubacterium sp.]